MKTEYLKFILLFGMGSILRFLLLLLVLGLMIGCSEEDIPGKSKDPNGTDPDGNIEGSWVKYSPYKWTHDGKPHQAVYCTVFSDGCSDEMKEDAGNLADDKFLEVLERFCFTNLDDMRYPTERKTIDVYINRYHPENMAAAYWGSIIITVRGSEVNTSLYDYLFKHELTHVFEFLIEGTVNLAGEMWFTESIAIEVGDRINRIRTVEDLESWISRNDTSPNKGNPITIKKWEDYPDGADKSGYTTLFEAVMEYMLDPEGLDRSMQDVLNLFYDLREKIPFEESFQKNFGVSVEVLEEEIFDRLRVYLNSNYQNSIIK
jgi:hypothetical protein